MICGSTSSRRSSAQHWPRSRCAYCTRTSTSRSARRRKEGDCGTLVHETEVAVGWWVAAKGAPLPLLGPTEINQETAKRVALEKSQARPGTVFQVRYHANANAPTEVRWED